MLDPALAELAECYGIEPGYHDIWGVWREASAGTVRSLLGAMGVSVDGTRSAKRALETASRERWSSALPATVVLRRSALAHGLPVRLPRGIRTGIISWRISEEQGGLREGSERLRDLPVSEECKVDGARRRAVVLSLPMLPAGYHRLEVFHDTRALAAAPLIVAPECCYLPQAIEGGRRLWGLALQLYGVRSGGNWGMGDLGDLADAVEQWAGCGASFVGVNPLHSLFWNNPEHASPYSPSSRLFLNPLYLDVEAIEEFAECAEARRLVQSEDFAACIGRLRAQEMVDYPGVAAAKKRILELLHGQFRASHGGSSSERAAAFEKFCRKGREALRRHALFETLQEHFHRLDPWKAHWQAWPEPYRDPESADVARFADEHAERMSFFLYLQWQAAAQLAAAQSSCRKAGMDVGLYLDLAVSIDRGGSDAWAQQGLYALDASVGAPPDDFNPAGQDWGLPPFSPAAMQRTGYAFFIDILRANMAAAGALRIDHVMGLARLFWLPGQDGAAEGAYVRYPLADLLAIVALESQRNRCMVIGEDLGTVPVQLRQALREWGVLSYRLMMFERDSAGRFQPPSDYPKQSLVAFSTHDLPTFAGYWGAQDAAARRALVAALRGEGLLPAGIDEQADLPPEALARLIHAVHLYLARSPALILSVQIEDLLGAAAQANLPGTPDRSPNWRRKLPRDMESMRGDARLRDTGDELRTARGACAVQAARRRS